MRAEPAVVGREEDERVVAEPQLLQLGHDLADLVIHVRDHRTKAVLVVGDALGRAMVELLESGTTGNTFADWIAGYPGVGGDTGFGDDPDGDGVSEPSLAGAKAEESSS